MSIQDSILMSLFGISVVFFVLIALSFLVRFQSYVISIIDKKQTTITTANQIEEIYENPIEFSSSQTGMSIGELKLIGVDERTAAMIMAIVSDESKIPLSELQFKSIKLLNK
jgi:hypothetical protein